VQRSLVSEESREGGMKAAIDMVLCVCFWRVGLEGLILWVPVRRSCVHRAWLQGESLNNLAVFGPFTLV